ncbi:MAG: RNA polymerase sigma factor [Bacteroidetes bacterium]|nr:RNA polymerase sigma factor [Bacteroidota bacterium]
MQGDKREMFDDMYNANKRRIYKLCLGYTGDEDVAQDLMQDVFVKAWNNLDKFREEAMLSTWLYRIAVNTCLAHLRKQKNRPSDELNDFIIETHQEEKSDKHVKVKMLYKSISLLEESERILISMVLDDVPYPEIAAIAGISEGNLRVKIHRIKNTLSEIYKKVETTYESTFIKNGM